MLNRPSATHPSQIFLHFHSISLRWLIYIINSLDKNKLSSLEAFVHALTFWNGLGWDFLRDSSKPFRWFSDSFTQVTKGNTAEKFVKTTAILRFGSTQSRRIPAVTHIKILSAEHAQTKCLYALVRQGIAAPHPWQSSELTLNTDLHSLIQISHMCNRNKIHTEKEKDIQFTRWAVIYD